MAHTMDIEKFIEGERKRERASESSDDDDGFVTVQRKKTKAAPTAKTPPKTGRLNKFKVEIGNIKEAYSKICLLMETHKKLNLISRPNLQSEWILTPKDQRTYEFLKGTSALPLKELKFEEKRKKAIVARYPLDMPMEAIRKHP